MEEAEEEAEERQVAAGDAVAAAVVDAVAVSAAEGSQERVTLELNELDMASCNGRKEYSTMVFAHFFPLFILPQTFFTKSKQTTSIKALSGTVENSNTFFAVIEKLYLSRIALATYVCLQNMLHNSPALGRLRRGRRGRQRTPGGCTERRGGGIRRKVAN